MRKIIMLVASTAALGVLFLSNAAWAAYPGENGKIVFDSNRPGHYEIYSMNPDGTEQTRLTFSDSSSVPSAYATQPVVSPDGTRIAFTGVSYTAYKGRGDIYVMDVDGTDVVRLTDFPASASGFYKQAGSPTWSPDGTKIAYSVAGGNQTSSIWVMNSDGTGNTRITEESDPFDLKIPAESPGAFASEPAWSPDGKKIAFSSNQNGDEVFAIFSVNPDGTDVTRLTEDRLWTGGPAWSPDGSKVTYHRSGDGLGPGGAEEHIWAMNADGTDQTVVRGGMAPVWSPDGTKILYIEGSQHGSPGVSMMAADGTVLQERLLDSSRYAHGALDWGPTPPPPAVCTFGEIAPPVNDVSGPTADGMSAYRYGSRGVIPAKFGASCDGAPIGTQAEADVHPMKLTLTKLGSMPDEDSVVEGTEIASSNTGGLFHFDDATDQYVYNVGVKGLGRGTYKITISEANGGGNHDEWFAIT